MLGIPSRPPHARSYDSNSEHNEEEQAKRCLIERRALVRTHRQRHRCLCARGPLAVGRRRGRKRSWW